MNVYPARHGPTNVFDRRGFTNAGGMIVDQESLKLLHLVVIQDYFGKLPNAGVRSIHNLTGLELPFEHRTTGFDSFECVWVEFDRFAVSGYLDKLFNREA
jgi:hypothetical protein